MVSALSVADLSIGLSSGGARLPDVRAGQFAGQKGAHVLLGRFRLTACRQMSWRAGGLGFRV